jgi:Zn-dependent protease
MPSFDSNFLYQISIWALPVILAITFHEAAHGFVARKLGDDTAWRAGRVTFNPVKHIDPLGTVALPLVLVATGAPFLFGWAKPVPVNFWNLREPRRDMVLVAAAGPGINLALAVASGLLLYVAAILPETVEVWAQYNLWSSIKINVVLAVFNLIPLPPLDGGRIAVGILPERLAVPLAQVERHGMLILIGAIMLLPFIGAQIGFNLNIFSWLMEWPVDTIVALVLLLTGHAAG